MHGGAANALSGRTVVNVPGWPVVFELNEGETYRLQRTAGKRSIERVIRVIGIKEFWEPDYWTDNSARRTLRRADVTVDVSRSANGVWIPARSPATRSSGGSITRRGCSVKNSLSVRKMVMRIGISRRSAYMIRNAGERWPRGGFTTRRCVIFVHRPRCCSGIDSRA